MTDAHEEIIALQRALRELVSTIDVTFSKQYEEFFVGYEGSFGSKHLTPRTLTARHLGNLVCVEGIVVKCEYITACERIYDRVAGFKFIETLRDKKLRKK